MSNPAVHWWLIARSTLAGVSYDIGAEGWAVRLPDTAELATELGLTVEKPTIAPSWVYFDDACFAMPDNAILGIPANLSDPAVVIALGAEKAARAAELDRAPMPEDLPRDLGTLVASRMVQKYCGVSSPQSPGESTPPIHIYCQPTSSPPV